MGLKSNCKSGQFLSSCLISSMWLGRADLLSRALAKSQEVTPRRLVGMDSSGQPPLWAPKEVELDKVGNLVALF